MEEVCVARLLRATTAFCSSIVHECDHGVSAPSMQMPSEIDHVPGKRKGIETLGESVKSGKRPKLGLRTLQVSLDSCSLVGRLQLCNKTRHSWGGLSAAGDCLAFTDSTASICCSVSRELDISFIGKLVKVNSWSFIPINDTRGSTKPSSDPHTGKTIQRILVTEGITSKRNSNFLAQDSQLNNVTTGAPENVTDVWNGHSDAADGSGFLEIHSLELLGKQDIRVATFPSVCVDPAAADIRNALFESPPFEKEGKRPRLTICGKLESVSPQFSLPCNYTDDRDGSKTASGVGASSKENRQKPMIGFLVELNYCHSCSCQYMDSWTMGTKTESRRVRQLFEDGYSSDGVNLKYGVYGDYDNRNSLHVFFSGSLASWRPILSVSVKRCLTISGLRKKLVLTGSGRKYQFLLVATRTSLILPVLDPHHRNVRECCTFGRRDSERKREEGISGVPYDGCTPDSERITGEGRSDHPKVISYAGFVTSVLFQGALVELDKHVWLLFTHQGKSQLHGLRVGAMLALREVHAIIIHNPSEKVLLLGACTRSHVAVLLFSPLYSPPLTQLQSPSLLLRYMRKVSFASAFWQKFRGIYSDKELMGSKKDPGIILKYVQKLLAPYNTLERPDYFKEFCDDEHISCSGGRVSTVPLSKVPPISNFIEATLQCSKSRIWESRTSGSTYFQRWLEKKSLLSSLEVSMASWQFAHAVISSQELGVSLLGSLQVCQKSGQLQLMDATGFVCAVVPDLFSSTHLYKTYQISSFTLVVKELAEEDSDLIGQYRCKGPKDSSVSWSSLLKDFKTVLALSAASGLLVHFYLRDAILVDTLSFHKGMGGSSFQGWKHRRLDQKHTMETGNRMEIDLETVSTWLEQRISELGSFMSPRSDLKLLCDSAGGLNLGNEEFRISCKVVAVDLLVFQCQGPTPSKPRMSSGSPPWPDLELNDDGWLLSLGIPLTLARVVVDDGYGLAHCWALGDVAASLLGLLKTRGQTKLHPNLLARLGDKYGRSDMQLTMMRCMCCLVRRYGQIVLRSQRPYGAPADFSYPLQWCGSSSPDCDDQAFMQAVVAGACLNDPLVVTLGNIPRAVKDNPESEKSPWEYLRALAYRAGIQSSRLEDKEWPQLFATKVESAVLLSDVRAVSDEVASLLKSEL